MAIGIFALATLSSAAPAPLFGLGQPATVPTPDVDPFYVPPSTFAKDAPGTVYRSRSALNPGLGRKGTQILFRTTDAMGNPATSVTTILQTLLSSNKYLVAYQMYEDASAPSCAPSYCFNTFSAQLFCPDGDGQLWSIMNRGWTVIVTDFLGTNSAFSVGHQSGYQVLDGYRAAINFLNLPKDVILGGYGYSGGAIGTGWSAALQNSYAPELNIKALAFGGTPANVTSTLLKVNGGPYAGFAVGGVVGQLSAYPELAALWEQLATPTGKALVKAVRGQCAVANLVTFSGKDILSTSIQSLGPAVLNDPLLAKYLAMSVLGSNKIETPTKPSIYMYHSKTDQVIPYESAYNAAQSWCNNGAKIVFNTELGGGGHLGTQVAYGETVFTWLDSQLRGYSPALTTCSFVNKVNFALPVRDRFLKATPKGC
ncbi:BQ2448_4570 [Microbotryum intermedium]|uniref:triacylglycerol lipase n=1 Tax=Microbotryum intermedium TaxID=269621 RepID=A0A238FLC0_9BASI|nr:BQ2448_4570 [Microbotryum intermedium]